VRRAALLLVALAATLGPAPSAHALVWPDVPERVEKDLGSPDALARRGAARQLSDLGPSRGAPLVLRALADSDPEVRLLAAQAAIRLRVQAAVDVVLPWLGEREARQRVAACEVLRELPEPARAVSQLARALGDSDATVRAAAADALGSQGSADAVAPLLGKLDDASPTVRIQIARALARLGDGRAVVPLAGKVQDSVPEVRQAVARALGELGDLRATQALLLQLRDGAVEVRVEALGALGRLRAPDAASAIGPLAAERTLSIRLAAMTALGRIATPDAVRALVALLGQGDDAGGGLERTPVREALVACGAAAANQLAAQLDRPPTVAIATSAAWVLGELHARDKATAIVQAMRRGALPVAAALRSLAGAGSSAEVPIVLEFASDGSQVVRAEAFRAAAALLDPARPDGRAVEPLAAALRDSRLSPRERADIAALLGRTGAPRAAPILAGLAAAKEADSRLAAIDALGTLGPAGADDALLERLADADPRVRLHAAVALADAGSAVAVPRLLAKLEVDEEVDRASVLTALGGVLARAPSEPAITKLTSLLDLAAGAERDALLEAIGRARTPSALRTLSTAAAGDTDDRRTAVTLLAVHEGRPEATALAARLTDDPDATVRAQAAWALGAIGEAGNVPALAALLARAEVEPAANAAASIGKIAGRAKNPATAAQLLCPVARDLRALVRVNALAGLSLAGARCDGGAVERRALESDPSDAVRRSAALALARAASSPEDRRALERCASSDRSGSVAQACRTAPTPAGPPRAVTVYPVAEGLTGPKPHAAYALSLADGTVHAGTADRRGATFEANAPAGELSLLRAGR
jgi:cellulose synthase operon protein C